MGQALDGKVAVVSGASGGIGKAVALALANAGAAVAVCSRTRKNIEAAAKEIHAATAADVLPIVADMGKPEDIERFVANTAAELGAIDILVNNAVSPNPGTLFGAEDEYWFEHFTVKVMGYIRCARAVVPRMRERGGGRIINIGGITSRQVGHAGGKAHSGGASNAAITNITKNLSDLVARDRITVNAVHPGPTRSDRQDHIVQLRVKSSDKTRDEVEQEILSTFPLGRWLVPHDVAELVIFLVGPGASAITGQAIAVDGGLVRGVFY